MVKEVKRNKHSCVCISKNREREIKRERNVFFCPHRHYKRKREWVHLFERERETKRERAREIFS